MSVLIQVKTETLMGDIGKELRVFFPSVNFQLTSKQEETRTYITISYTDGVSKMRVRNIARQFAYSYPSGGEMIRVHILIERKMSDTVQSKLLNEMKSVWKVKGNLHIDDHFEPIGGTVKSYVQKIFDMRDFD
ncbi:hypothetical protein [Dysgonomonas sp. UBA7698]|uniref:hypothetical protein n=1 Tax=Dysgonomonas sp. UBA7698 TaxID=1946427 RepID=UPI0025C436BC|nr:hypothetical protein [Dysgonomonas sp. UBA7698]